MEKKAITMLPVSCLMHHPKNPRQDIGDVTELAASIKEKGILQNLTVIVAGTEEWGYNGANQCGIEPFLEEPEKHNYFVLIGNRRLEGAKAAGLEELPCTIEGRLSLADQVGIMMQENMQREDLTIPEEAFGFQMMLDLGDTVKSISEKTGFSETKIRHRVKIAELDKDVLKDKLADDGFQLTIKDLIGLEKVTDPEVRNKILKNSKNSNDMQWRVKNYVEEKEKEERLEKAKQILEDAGIEHKKSCDTWTPSDCVALDRIPIKEFVEEYTVDDGWEGEAEYYGIYPYGDMDIILVAPKPEKDDGAEEEEEESVHQKIRKLSDEINRKFNQVISDMRDYGYHIIKDDVFVNDMPTAQELWNEAVTLCPYTSFDSARQGMDDAGLFDDLNVEEYEDGDAWDEAVDEKMKNVPLWQKIFVIIVGQAGPNNYDSAARSWNANIKDLPTIIKGIEFYNFIHRYDYEYEDEKTKLFMRGEGTLWEQMDALIAERDKKDEQDIS